MEELFNKTLKIVRDMLTEAGYQQYPVFTSIRNMLSGAHPSKATLAAIRLKAIQARKGRGFFASQAFLRKAA